MKTIKSILIAATLICATAVSAQEAQPAQKHEFRVAKGDSVMIKRDCQKYLTGERPSIWVWDKVHTVRQLGSKRFPEGVLLMNIYSWICEDCITVVNGRAQEAREERKAEREEEKAAEEAAKAAEEQAKADSIQAAKAAEEAAKAAEEAAKAAEEAAKAAEEAAKADSIAAAEQIQREMAKGDSIHSQQKFRAGYDRFTIGVRGGIASQLHKSVKGSDAKWGIGADALLDLQYAHYWTKDGRPVDLGLIVGLSVGYAQGNFNGSADSTFQKGDLDYTIKAGSVKETDRQIQLEVPLMFSLIHESGLFFNIGPKFMMPVYTPLKQTIKRDGNEAIIAAYDPALGVTYRDDVVTGQYNGQKAQGGNDLQFKINIMLTAELGYEWILNSGNSLGLGVYANYCVYNSRKQLKAAAHESLLDIATPPTDGGIAELDVYSATSTYAKSVGYFDLGVKLAYHFNFPKKKQTKDAKLF